ncbi:MAG TPA: cupredoxin domain-containing protein [Alphaproteobacteria bacterium]|nr:cupredoxin domain-containing protein [Alphaproteobacteria bacterium]
MKTLFSLAPALAIIMGGVANAADPIVITASDWKFTPNEITLKAGQPQVLRLTSLEGVHGLLSDALGIAQTIIVPGKNTDVTVTPKRVGTYVVHCSIECGAGHPNMALKVVVDP